MATDRRTFLELCAAGALASALPGCISRALKIPPNRRTGTIEDVEHIVILMQENRSFDHYFGTLQGVRGFGDPRACTLPGGEPVWYQPHGSVRCVHCSRHRLGRIRAQRPRPKWVFSQFQGPVGELDSSFGWYDLTITVDADASFQQRIAGHVETGKDSMTDPAIGGL